MVSPVSYRKGLLTTILKSKSLIEKPIGLCKNKFYEYDHIHGKRQSLLLTCHPHLGNGRMNDPSTRAIATV